MGSHGLHCTTTLCTLIDTNLCKPDDDQARPKHVADVMMGSHGLHCKPWDPINTATLCTLIDTNLCKPDDGQTRPKHVADVTSCRIQLSIVLCKDSLIQYHLSFVSSWKQEKLTLLFTFSFFLKFG